jgi:hypothetical protein
LEISFSQGAEWKALISKYIGTIPVSGHASCPDEQSISGEPPPETPVSSAIIANVGAAARHSQSGDIFFVPVERGDIEMSFPAATSKSG